MRLSGRSDTLPYALHKMEVEKAIQQRALGLRGCSVCLLRSHIFAGKPVDNYIVGAFRGTTEWAQQARAASDAAQSKGTRLPCLLPMGHRYVENRKQFVHVDDVARLAAYILRRTDPETQRLTVLNVAGRGVPLSLERCFEIACAEPRGAPARFERLFISRYALRLVWGLGISATPPEAAPYIMGEYLMNTQRLREFLGADYETVMRYTVEEAFEDLFEAIGQNT